MTNLEINLIRQLKREGYQDNDIVAICKDKTIGLNEREIKKILNDPKYKPSKPVPITRQGIKYYSAKDTPEELTFRCYILG